MIQKISYICLSIITNSETTKTQVEEQVNYNTNTLQMEALHPWYKCCSFFNKATDAISVLTYKYIVYFKSMKFLTI